MSTEWGTKKPCRSWSMPNMNGLKFLGTRLKHKLKKVDDFLNEHFDLLPKDITPPPQFPIPTPPISTPTNYNYPPFPEPAPPQGTWSWTPAAGQHDNEASGSNHTSKPNSEYFDAVDPSEYQNQYQIPNYSADFHARPSWLIQQDHFAEPSFNMNGTQKKSSVEEQLAFSFDEMQLLGTPTSQDHHSNHGLGPYCAPTFSEFPVSVNYDQYNKFSGEVHSDAVTEQHQSWQTVTDEIVGDDVTSTTTNFRQVGNGSMMSVDMCNLDNCMMDSGASPYICAPVPEERPPSSTSVTLQTFGQIYWGLRRILSGEMEVSGGSGRRGRGIRVLASIVCIAIRLKRLKGKRVLRRVQLGKRTYNEPCHLRRVQYNMKRIRITGGSTESASPVQHSNLYKAITKRNGKWNAEIRVSMTGNVKIWLGTYASEKEAALAYDAGLHHCTAKKKKFNFPDLVLHLGPSHYNDVLALCKDGRKEDATTKVKRFAEAHAGRC